VTARRPRLRALAERAGILASYVATSGERRFTSDATRAALLAALGHDASTEAAAARALRALGDREAQALVEPVRVALAGRPGARSVRVRLPAGARARVDWSLELRDEAGGIARAAGASPRRGDSLLLRLPAEPGLGYHALRVSLDAGEGERCEAEQRLVVTPRRCTSVDERLGRRRGFGVLANLYTLRSARNWGVGDLGDLRRLVRLAGRAGACFVGTSPLHALWNRRHEICPYVPVSRLYRNPLYLEIEAVPELAACEPARSRLAEPSFRRELEALRSSPQIEYERAARAKDAVLLPLHRVFAERHRDRPTPRGRAYAHYREREGEALDDFAAFLALAQQLGEPKWRAWPAPYRDPRSPAVERFRREQAEAIDFHRFVQFELDRQLGACARAARTAGLAVGLYGDLAIGTSPSGSDTWALPGVFVAGARIGAPPDDFAPEGQDWATPPLDPAALRATGYAHWVRLLRAAFAHFGALRVDHAMGLARLYWIPAGRPASEGAYVRYPAEDLFGILALESRRAGALVVAEDLGTTPRGFSARLARRGILSSRVLYFERRGVAFRPARSYSRRALVTANTHDLAPLAGFAAGRDLELRRRAGALASDAALAAARRERAASARALARRLADDGCLPPGSELPGRPALCNAVTAFLCQTPAPLVGVALDDLAGETEPVNLPGVGPERHPSWKRRMALPVERLGSDAGVRAGLAAVPPDRRSGR